MTLPNLSARGNRAGGGVAFFDRSPVCTLAPSRYAGLAPTRALLAEIEATASFYERGVFFVRNLGFVEKAAARYEIIEVPPGPLPERIALVGHHTSRS